MTECKKNENMIVSAILDEYRRICDLPGGYFGTRNKEMRLFKVKLSAMKAAGALAKDEYDDVMLGMESIDNADMKKMVKEIRREYVKCF